MIIKDQAVTEVVLGNHHIQPQHWTNLKALAANRARNRSETSNSSSNNCNQQQQQQAAAVKFLLDRQALDQSMMSAEDETEDEPVGELGSPLDFSVHRTISGMESPR